MSEHGRILSKCVRWLGTYLMFKDSFLACTTVSSHSALVHLSRQIPLAELTNTAVSRQHEFYPRRKQVFGVSVTAVDSSVYTSLWLLHCKHLDEPLPWYSSHQCSVANLSFFLHELCDFSTWSYHPWLHLNPRFTQIPLYCPAIHTGDLPRCAYSMPLLLARVSVLQWVCFAIERV